VPLRTPQYRKNVALHTSYVVFNAAIKLVKYFTLMFAVDRGAPGSEIMAKNGFRQLRASQTGNGLPIDTEIAV
jgi:hypothetical protein